MLASVVHKHPKFDPNVSPDNDIAILKVTTTEKYNLMLISSLAGQGSHHMLVFTKLKLHLLLFRCDRFTRHLFITNDNDSSPPVEQSHRFSSIATTKCDQKIELKMTQNGSSKNHILHDDPFCFDWKL